MFGKLGVNIIVRNEKGELLVQKRGDDGCYGMPGGWVDDGETPDQAIARELMEEAGLTVEDMYIADALHRPAGSIHLTYVVRKVSGTLRGSDEGEVMYLPIDQISPWHRDHGETVRRVLQVKL